MSTQTKITRKTTFDIRKMKQQGEKISVLTAYDYGTAVILDESDIDIILVGDSLGNVILGYDTTVPVTMEDMLHHTRAVARGTRRAMVVADLPFMSYQVSHEAALINAGRLLKEADAQAVKLEGGREHAELVRKMTVAGIPVMAHLGLTPQSIHQLGGFRVQGKKEDAAEKMMQDALALEEAGAFSLVLECVPGKLAADITAALSIPTIGIGAGKGTAGQVLVMHDMLGVNLGRNPKFVHNFMQEAGSVRAAIEAYVLAVKQGRFPDDAVHAW